MDLNSSLKLLNCSKKSSLEEIRHNYRNLAKKYHPDLNPEDKTSEEMFKKLSKAYNLICKKKRYNNDQIDSNVFEDLRHSMNPVFERIKEQRKKKTFSKNPYRYSYVDINIGSEAFRKSLLKKGSLEKILKKVLKKDPKPDSVSRAKKILDKTKDFDMFCGYLSLSKNIYNNFKVKEEEEIIETVEILSKSKNLEQMVICANSCRNLLKNHEFDEQTLHKTDYSKLFNLLFSSLYSSVKSTDGALKVLDLKNLFNSYFSSIHNPLVLEKYRAKLISSLMQENTLDYANELLKNSRFIFAGSFLEPHRRFVEFEKTMKNIITNTDYDKSNFIDLLKVINKILDDSYLKFSLKGVETINKFVTKMSESIPLEDVILAREFVENISLGARGYEKAQFSNEIQDEWARTFRNYLGFFKSHKNSFSKAIKAISQLKYGNSGEIQWWPGIFHTNVETVAYLSKRLVNESIKNKGIVFIEEFGNLLKGFRSSEYFGKKSKNSSELTSLQKQVYLLLKEIRRGRKELRIGPRRFLMQDADKILDLYIRDKS